MIGIGHYLFNTNLEEFPKWRRKFPGLRAVWMDSGANTARSFGRDLAAGVLIVEEDLFPRLKDAVELPSPGQIFVEASHHKTTVVGREFKVCMLPSNDTHVASFSRLEKPGIDFNFRVFSENSEGAAEAIRLEGREYSQFDVAEGFDGLLLGNDWGDREKACCRGV